MALTTPDSASDVIERAVSDILLTLAEHGAKPSLRNSWLNALIVAFCNRVFDFYYALDQVALESIPDTASINLDRWASIWGITRTAGTASSGNVIASGVVGSEIPAETILKTGEGKEYSTRATVLIDTKSLAVTSITRSGSTATLTTTLDHELGSQILISVTGANQAEYNVTDAVATITGPDTLTYEVTGSPTTPATGTILLGFDSATLIVDSEDYGDAEDQDFDAALRFESPIVGVDDVARVDYDAIGGGADRETDDALQERLLDRIQNPVAHFNVAEITAVAKSIPGVTRVFVEEITPAVGQVTIYFMRDEDANPIPSGAEVTAVDDVIQAIRPANSAEADVIVVAPTAVSTNFVFTDIQPNTASMKAAVEANLAQFFAERTQVGENVDSDAYRSAIFNTVDVITGDVVTTFTLSAPTGDITITSGQIGTLGNVTF